MFFDWQTLIALMIVAGAIAWLLRRVSRWWYGGDLPASSGGCGGCSQKNSPCGSQRVKELPLVGLQIDKKR